MTGQTYIKGNLCNDKGMWVVRARIHDNATGKTKQLSKSTGYKTTGSNKRKAELKMREIVSEWELRYLKGCVVNENITFSECVKEWQEHKKITIRENTYRSYCVMINKHIIPVLGNIKIKELSRQHIQKYFQDLTDVISPCTMRKHKAILHSIVENACLNGIISNNVVNNIEISKPQKKETKSLTTDELKHLLTCAENASEPTKSIIILGGCYGLRRSEICGLRWNDIDFNKGVMHIRNTITTYSGLMIEREQTKNDSSNRELVLLPNTIPYLECLKKESKSDKVCSYENGRTPFPETVSDLASKFIEKCGFKGIKLHGLRHTVASVLARELPPKMVQDFMGHSDIQTTLNIYTHLTIQDKQTTSNTMNSIIGSM